MATSYTIDFTDKNPNRSFQLAPYTTNGPGDPTSGTLDGKASSAATSLLLYGKGSPDYGERIQEDIVHLLEHFAGTIEPSYPVGGQIWFNNGVSPSNIQVYDPSKHLILSNLPPNTGAVDYLTISGDHRARFEAGFRLRIVNIDLDGSQEEYLVGTNATLDGNNNTLILLTPAPTGGGTRVGWYIGGWEYLVQNNAGLHEDLNANGNTISALGVPQNQNDAATKDYVDLAISNSNELGELTDVNLTGPIAENEILAYDAGASVWRNRTTTEANVLSLSGGLMTGIIDMNSNTIQGIPTPSGPTEAANMQYVDDEILAALSGSITELEDLTDVIYGGAQATNDTLQFNGAIWTNVNKSTFATNMDMLPTTGGTMTDFLILHADPDLNFHAATKFYVDTEIVGAISASGDGVVDGGWFDSAAQELTLTRTNGLSSVVVTGFAAGGTTSNAVIHDILNPTLTEEDRNLFMESTFGTSPDYPEVTVEDVFIKLNQHLGNLITRKSRFVIVSDGLPAVELGHNSSYGDLPYSYVTGLNVLNVYVNGTRQVISEPGYLQIEPDSPPGGGDTDDLVWDGFPTGLTPGTTYYFQVTLNTGAANGSQIGPLTVPILGDTALTVGQLVKTINSWADDPVNRTNFGQASPMIEAPPFGCFIEDAVFNIVSAYPGTGSRIDVVDGDGGVGDGLFANWVGGIDPAGVTHTYTFNPLTINDGLRNDGLFNVDQGVFNAPPPITWAINEIGRTHRTAEYFYFTDAASTPPINSVIEIVIDQSLVYDKNTQPTAP